MIDPLIQFIDIESEQWANFRSRGPLASKPQAHLVVYHENRKPISAALGGAPLNPIPGDFEDARGLAKKLYAQYRPSGLVWIFDQASMDRYNAACTTWSGELDPHSYEAHKREQAAKLATPDFTIYPLEPVKVGYLTLDEARRFLNEELAADALLILGVFEDQLFFSLVVRIENRSITVVTTSDHFARQIAAAGYGQENGTLPFIKEATAALEKLAQEELGPVAVSLYTRRNVYNDLFTDSDRVSTLKQAELRGDAWGTALLPDRHNAWQKMVGLLSYVAF